MFIINAIAAVFTTIWGWLLNLAATLPPAAWAALALAAIAIAVIAAFAERRRRDRDA